MKTLTLLVALALGCSSPVASETFQHVATGEGGAPSPTTAETLPAGAGPLHPPQHPGNGGARPVDEPVEAGAGGSVDASEGGAGGAPEPEPVLPVVYVLLEYLQQSNGAGTDVRDPPAGIPDASIPFWSNDLAKLDGPREFRALDVRAETAGTFSHEIRTAQRLKQAGHRVAVIKLTKGGSFINRWIPGAYISDVGEPELRLAWATLPSLFPEGTRLVPIWVVDQGESEARYFDQPSVEKWSSFFLLVQAQLESIVGEPLKPYVVQTSSTIRNKTFPGVLEAQQASVAHGLIDPSDLPTRADGVHRTGASQNIVGERIADAILADIASGVLQ